MPFRKSRWLIDSALMRERQLVDSPKFFFAEALQGFWRSMLGMGSWRGHFAPMTVSTYSNA